MDREKTPRFPAGPPAARPIEAGPAVIAATSIPGARRLPDPAAGVACWEASLADGDLADHVEDAALLSPAERQRALRFGVPDLRRRYENGRAALRRVLAVVLGCAPAAVPIVRGHRGRPYVEGASIDFNVSNTADIAVIAVATRGRVGIDVERVDRSVRADRLALKVMSARERAALGEPGSDAQRRRFLRAWTCKEAMSKATGDGIAAPFRRIEVDVDALALLAGPGPYAPGPWALHDVRVLPEFVATLALWTAEETRPPAA